MIGILPKGEKISGLQPLHDRILIKVGAGAGVHTSSSSSSSSNS